MVKKYKNGFSLIEVMLILLFFSLILAASMPMITRKHSPLPERIHHGRYACFYDGDTLVEQLYSGQHLLKETNPTKCSFEPPKKVKYFYVQVIGGGGGGSYAPEYNVIEEESSARYDGINDWNYLLVTPEEFNSVAEGVNAVVKATGEAGDYCTKSQCDTGTVYTGRYVCVQRNSSGTRTDETDLQGDGTCLDGYTKEEVLSSETCYNEKYGKGGSWYDSFPLTWGVTVSESDTIGDSGTCGTSYTGACYMSGGQGSYVNYNGKTMKATGGYGAMRGYTKTDSNGQPVCSQTYPDVDDASCTGTCLTSAPSGYLWSSIDFITTNYWQSQKLYYGNGGTVGGYKSFITKELDEDTLISPGKGGTPQTASTYGTDGGESCFGDVCVSGGNCLNSSGYDKFNLGGSSRKETLGTLSTSERYGETSSFNDEIKFFLFNILNEYKEKFKNFGKGGNGTATQTVCTDGYDYYVFEVTGGKSIVFDGETEATCDGHTWSKDHYVDAVSTVEQAQRGASGAIIISW